MADVIKDAVEFTPYWTDDPATHQDPYENAEKALTSAGYGYVRAHKFVLGVREAELLQLKGPCSFKDCRLHYAHSGPCDTREEVR